MFIITQTIAPTAAATTASASRASATVIPAGRVPRAACRRASARPNAAVTASARIRLRGSGVCASRATSVPAV